MVNTVKNSDLDKEMKDLKGKKAEDIPEILAIIPLKDNVVFPQTITPIKIEKKTSLKAIDEAMAKDKVIGVTAFKEGLKDEDLTAQNIYPTGTAVLIHKMLKVPNQGIILIVQGIKKIDIAEMIQVEPYWKARVSTIEDIKRDGKDLQALMVTALNRLETLVQMVPYLPEELHVAATQVNEPLRLCYLISSLLRMKLFEKQEVLEIGDVKGKLTKVVEIMNREIELLELGNKIQGEVEDEMGRNKREYFLRQQIRAIQKELGEVDEGEEVDDLRKKIDKLKASSEVKKEAQKELGRLQKMPPASSEYHIIRTYLDWIIEVPWQKSSKDHLDIGEAEEKLDEDHYGLKKVKERVLEYLAVRKLKKDMKGPILCLVGPPGVGKTSLGRSIARSLNRKFVRQSLGGMHDEAEIRGHRRTYIGAMPGKIIQSLRRAKTNNPVMMLDEIDKVGQDFRGDPSSALLEVLDPEQNNAFIDHYLGLSFDLSKVLFIATANSLSTIQRPLLDRMEVIELNGYSLEEKVHIARKYLLPKQIKEHGLKESQLSISDKALDKIIDFYTRESGVRSLERNLAKICRKVAMKMAKSNLNKDKKAVEISIKNLRKYLGVEKNDKEVAQRLSLAGVATGLAWTASGGDILFIEATKMPGSKGFVVTGQLGDVMQESAKTAFSVVRSRAKKLGIKEDFFKETDIHLHVPAGAIPKDGPSAGITMATALASLLTKTRVNKEVAMTGEITLSGQVLPIGGIKEKILAARRAGIKKVLLPKRNKKDFSEIDDEYKKGVDFVFVDTIDEVLKESFIS